MTILRALFLVLITASTISCGGGSSSPVSGGSGTDSGTGSGGGSGGDSGGDTTSVTKDFSLSTLGISVSRPSNGDAVEVDMSGISQSGSVIIKQ